MKALEVFKYNIGRARTFLEIHKSFGERGRPPDWSADLLRAGIIFAVSALDTYLHDKINQSVTPFLIKKKGEHLPGAIMEIFKGVSHEKLLEIMFEERPKAHLSEAVKNHFSDKTLQDPAKIEGALRVIGVDDLWFLLGRELKLSKKKAKIFIQPYIIRRHQIAHEADLGTSKKHRHKLRRIIRPEVNKAIDNIERFVESLDKIIDGKLN